MTPRAILYTRVSTDEQAEHGYSLQSQLETCQKYAAGLGYPVADEITDDYSGAKLDRPGLDKVRAMLERHEAEAVIVFSPDRLTRSLAHSLVLREEWQRAGVELHYCNRGKSEDNPESRMTENIEAVFGDYWRAKIIEGSARGRRTKAANGKWPCDGQAAYGYRKEGIGREAKLVIEKDEAKIVRRVFRLYVGDAGRPLSHKSIAAALTAEKVPPPNRGRGTKRPGTVWYKTTVSRMLKHRAYMGEFHYGEQTIHLPELALIDCATFKAAEKRATKSPAAVITERKYNCLLAGHMRCACGKSMSAHPMAAGRPVYYCCNSVDSRHLRECKEHMIRADRADSAVWNWLSAYLLDEERLDRTLRDMADQFETETAGKRARLALLDDLIAAAEKKIKRLGKAFADEPDEILAASHKSEMKQAGRERAALVAERDTIAADIAAGQLSEADMDTIKAISVGIRRRMQAPTFEQKRVLLNLLDVQVKLNWNEEKERGIFAECRLKVPPGQAPGEPAEPAQVGQWLSLTAEWGVTQNQTGLLPAPLF